MLLLAFQLPLGRFFECDYSSNVCYKLFFYLFLFSVWANHGDEISIQYSGTPALKGDFVRLFSCIFLKLHYIHVGVVETSVLIIEMGC